MEAETHTAQPHTARSRTAARGKARCFTALYLLCHFTYYLGLVSIHT